MVTVTVLCDDVARKADVASYNVIHSDEKEARNWTKNQQAKIAREIASSTGYPPLPLPSRHPLPAPEQVLPTVPIVRTANRKKNNKNP